MTNYRQTTVTLPSGTVWSLADFARGGIFGTVDVVPGLDGEVNPFEYGIGGIVSGSGREATAADTSLIKSGAEGLPKKWRSVIESVRATIIGPSSVVYSETMRAWLSSTSFLFTHDNLTVTHVPIADVVTRDADTSVLPLTSETPFGVRITPHNPTHIRDLAELQAREKADLKIRVFLNGWHTRPSLAA